MTTIEADIFVAPATSPSDVSMLRSALDEQRFAIEDIVAVIAQTEGWIESRTLGLLAMSRELAPRLGLDVDDVSDRIPMMMIGMCGGLMSPHYAVLLRRPSTRPPGGEPRMVVGVADTDAHLPEEIGTLRQVEGVANATASAITDAGIEPSAVECVEIKCPAMTPARIADARSRGMKLITDSIAVSSARSRGCAALGAAIALGEVDQSDVTDAAICNDWSLFSRRASVSAGGEQTKTRVVVLGNSVDSSSPLRVGGGVMTDALDLDGVLATLVRAGIEDLRLPLTDSQQAAIAHVFVNCGANGVESTRHRRHTMNTDFLSQHAGSFAKAVGHAVVASITGDPMILASAGPEHQGPLGANLVAALVRHDE